MWKIMLLLVVANSLQMFLFNKQMKKFNTLMYQLQKKGNVLVGKDKGFLKQGSLVIFLLEEAIVKESYYIKGRTVFIEPQELVGYLGQHIQHLTLSQPTLQRAYQNALTNYHSM